MVFDYFITDQYKNLKEEKLNQKYSDTQIF